MVTTAISHALFFAALVLVYYSLDPHTFLIRELTGGKISGRTFPFLGRELSVSSVSFLLFGASLALRVPIWPLHGWFTKVAEESPGSVFTIIAGVSVPAGCYIFGRLGYALFPDTLRGAAQIIVTVACVNLIFGGVCAVAQKRLMLLIAYACVSQVGLILLGMGSLSSPGAVGAVYQQMAMGLGIAGFGLFSGILSDRTGSEQFLQEEGGSRLGGIVSSAPLTALVAGVVLASLLGIPGLSGFVGQSLLIIGSYTVHPAAVLLAGGATLLSTYYLLTMYRSVFLGKANGSHHFQDLTFREQAYFLPLVGGLLFFGVYPRPLIELVRPTVLTFLSLGTGGGP